MGLLGRLLLGVELDNNKIETRKKNELCGGTDRYIDKNAAKEILSDDMCMFDVTSTLSKTNFKGEEFLNHIRKISCFASKSGDGIFILFSKETGYKKEVNDFKWAYIKDDIFAPLNELVKKHEFIQKNGHVSKTHGLPRDFGGSATINYESGEKIYFSNNQSPILTDEIGYEILEIFETYSNKEKVELPNVNDLISIRYVEERIDGGYTHTKMSIYGDGTGVNYKESKYSDSKIYTSEKNVDSYVISNIKEILEKNGILAWEGLPKTENKLNHNATIFEFSDGREIKITNDTVIPNVVHGALFKIQMELTTRN